LPIKEGNIKNQHLRIVNIGKNYAMVVGILIEEIPTMYESSAKTRMQF
jgi:hypothetical protein